jgi:hypothetical protein
MPARRVIAVLMLGMMTTTPLAKADLVRPLASSLGLTAQASVEYGSPMTSTDSESQGTTINPLSVAVQADSNFYNYESLSVTGTASAAWMSPSLGEVTFSNLGWESYQTNGLAYLSGSTGWTYTFADNAMGPFVINYNVTAEGSSSTNPLPFLGLIGFYVYFGTGMTPPSNAIFETGLNTSGTISLPISPGVYTIEIQPPSNLGGGIGTTDAHMNGTFDFSIGSAPLPVPEPSSLTMVLMVGIASAVRALKRR